MNALNFASLGQTWINLVNQTVLVGSPMGEEGNELLGVQVGFPAREEPDPVLEQFGDKQAMAEMDKVFFSGAPNVFGHSYAQLMRGPEGGQDLGDVIGLLKAEPWSKRAVVTFCGTGNGKVPCVNAIQFLLRDDAVLGMYFARGQDAYRKFYADGLCLAKMTLSVASGLGLPAGAVKGFIGSSHIYHRHRSAIEQLLKNGRKFLSESGLLERT